MYKSIFFIVYLLSSVLSIPVNSQDMFLKIIGTSGDDSGSLFRVGEDFYFLGFTNANGTDDIYLAQINEHFNVNWSKTYSSNSGEKGFELIQKSTGSLMISAWGNSASSTLLLEVNSTGDLIEATGFGTIHDRLHKIIKTSDGGYLNYGELEGLVPGHNKVSLIKYDLENNLEWKTYYDPSGSNDSDPNSELYTRQIIQLIDTSYMILASYTDLGNPSGNRKIRIIKTDKNGNEQWVKGYHGGKMDNASHMILCDDGGLLISSTSNSYSNNSDILIIKTNENGEQEWLKTYGGNGDELAGQIFQTQNGHFMISGSTNSFGQGGYDIFLFEIDENGAIIKAQTYGGDRDDYSIKLDTISGFYLLSGNSTSFDQGERNGIIVKTAFNDASSDCSLDVTALLKSKIVTSTYTSDHYSQGVFVSPTVKNLTTSPIASFEMEPCYSCPATGLRTEKICPDDSILIDYRNINPISVIWQDGSTQPFRFLKTEGTYWVAVTTIQCDFRDSIIVKEEQIYNLDLGGDRPICYEDTTELDATIPNALSYKWHDGSSLPIYKATGPGFYKVQVTTNCTVISDSVQLYLPENDDVFIPNIITPNNDGYNDFFEIVGTDFNVTLLVVNRWGKEVYRASSYQNNWNGQNLPTGNYYYTVNIGCTKQNFNGWLKIFK